jgi:hypothetical protein
VLKDIVEVEPLEGYRLFVRFEDGVQGVVDVSDLVRFEGVFAPLEDLDQFRQASVNPELGVVCWPNGADLDPDVLYAHLTGTRIDTGSPAPA